MQVSQDKVKQIIADQLGVKAFRAGRYFTGIDRFRKKIINCVALSAIKFINGHDHGLLIYHPMSSKMRCVRQVADGNNKTRHTKDGDANWPSCLWLIVSGH